MFISTRIEGSYAPLSSRTLRRLVPFVLSVPCWTLWTRFEQIGGVEGGGGAGTRTHYMCMMKVQFKLGIWLNPILDGGGADLPPQVFFFIFSATAYNF